MESYSGITALEDLRDHGGHRDHFDRSPRGYNKFEVYTYKNVCKGFLYVLVLFLYCISSFFMILYKHFLKISKEKKTAKNNLQNKSNQ